MNEIDPLKELEQQSQKLEQIKVNEDNHQEALSDVESLLSSIEEKLNTILKSLTP